jgi:Histidine kinase-, DNA gyrase B-, and HSP90-like ATPase
LSVIIGNLQRPEREAGAQSPLRNRIATALGAASRGSDLTRRLLSFSRRKTVDPKPIDANAVVAGLEDLLERTISSSIQFSIAMQANIWPICVDAGELENALLNLAINAGDAMPNGGSLVLTTRNLSAPAISAGQAAALPPGEYVEIAVSDTGCGMPPEVVSKAFEPFFTTKEPGKGTGLGLSIVYGLAARAGGTAVIDTRPGAGTSVKLFFPRHLPATPPAVARAPRGAAPAERGRVLVIDAAAERAAETRRVLSEGGFDVAVHGRSAEVLEAATAPDCPDLVLIGDLPNGDLAPVALADRVRLLNPSIRVLHSAGTGLRQGVSPSVLPADTPDLVGAVRFALAAKEPASHV